MDVGGAVLGRLEDHGVDEPNERRVGDAVVDLEVVGLLLLDQPELLLDHGAGAEGLRGTDEAAELGLDVLAAGDADVEWEARREAELVDRVDVRRVGDRDAKRAVVEEVRDRDDALQNVERHLLRSLVVDRVDCEIDERQLEAGRERTRDALAGRDALIEDRLGQRAALLGAATDERELVGRDEARRGQEIDHELGHGVDRHAAAEWLCAALEALVPDRAERRRLLLFELVHRFNPSNELSAQPSKVLSTFGG